MQDLWGDWIAGPLLLGLLAICIAAMVAGLKCFGLIGFAIAFFVSVVVTIYFRRWEKAGFPLHRKREPDPRDHL